MGKDFLNSMKRSTIHRDRPQSARETPFEKGKREGGTDYLNLDRYQRLQKKLDAIVFEHFPDELVSFQRPSWQRIIESTPYYTTLTHRVFSGAREASQRHLSNLSRSKEQQSILYAAAVIRYVDDFLDTALWPHIHEYKKEEISSKVSTFLNSVLAFAQSLEPHMPKKIIELPLLELDLELNPTQENFDAKILEFLERKAFDMRYIGSLLSSHYGKQESWKLWNIGVSIKDLLRDFDKRDYSESTDFNLHNYLGKHRLNPEVLINFVAAYANGMQARAARGVYDELLTEDITKEFKLAAVKLLLELYRVSEIKE